MADLLDMLSGGGRGGLGLDPIDSREANTLSLLEAMQSVGEAGTRRTASPLGSIAQVLAPIFAAPIQARRMERQDAVQSLLLRAKIVDALRGSGSVRTAAQEDLDTAKAEESRAQAMKLRSEAASPFGGASASMDKLRNAAAMGDPQAKFLYDFAKSEEEAQRVQERNLINQGQMNMLDAREAAAKARERNKALSTGDAYLDPVTGRRLNVRTVGDLQDLPTEAKRMTTRQASKVSDIKTAYRELQALRGAGKQVLYDIKPEEASLLKSFLGVTGKRGAAATGRQAGDVASKEFDAYRQSFPLALSKALQDTSRQPPVAEFGATKNIDNTDSIQSMDAKLNRAQEWLVGILHDYGFEDPYSILNEGPAAASPVSLEGLPKPMSTHSGPVPVSTAKPFSATYAPGAESDRAKAVVRDIYRRNPKATDEEVKRELFSRMPPRGGN